MRCCVIISDDLNPYRNLAVEQWLVQSAAPDVVTMYLWRNRRTVVIGRHQNPFAECNLDLLNAEGGFLARRTTGGGAVFHDEGNLNFSFILPPSLYDLSRQFDVVARALKGYGLTVEFSGRNDMLCEGRKFSGNAFSKGKSGNLHHGTLLIDGDTGLMRRYLKPKEHKLLKHGVDSVRSRVVNLAELAPVTVENVVPRLIDSFESEYGAKAEALDYGSLFCRDEVEALRRRFASEEWLTAQWRDFQASSRGVFDWGEVEVALLADSATRRIVDIKIASDSLQPAAVDYACELLKGASLETPPAFDKDEYAVVVKDILSLIYEREL